MWLFVYIFVAFSKTIQENITEWKNIEQLARHMQDPKIECQYNAQIGETYFHKLNDHESAKETFRRGMKIQNCYPAYRQYATLKNLEGKTTLSARYFQKALELSRGPHASKEWLDYHKKSRLRVSYVSVHHARDQLEYLIDKRLVSRKKYEQQLAAYGILLNALKNKKVAIELRDEQLDLIPSYRTAYHIEDPPRVKGSTLRYFSEEEVENFERQYHETGIIYIDDFLKPEVVKSLYKYALRSTIYYDDKPKGYVGSYLHDGFHTPLAMQVADHLKKQFPNIFRDFSLHMAWSYNYDDDLEGGIGVHGDTAAVNCNFWVTPDKANLDKESGGLVIYTKPIPLSWSFDEMQMNEDRLMEHVSGPDSETVRIPYQYNRIVIFKSDLAHTTDHFRFKKGYKNRRINFTFLFGNRGSGRDALSKWQRNFTSPGKIEL